MAGVARLSSFAVISLSRQLSISVVPMSSANIFPDEVWFRVFEAKMHNEGAGSLLSLLCTCRRFAVGAGTSSCELR
jgi:hypothetical protein